MMDNEKKKKRENRLKSVKYISKFFAYVLSIPLMITLLGFLFIGMTWFDIGQKMDDLEKVQYCSNCGYDLIHGGIKWI